jgi:O-antigen/teichoic acid export membrane protein
MLTKEPQIEPPKSDISHKTAKALKDSMLAQVANILLSFAKTFVFTLFIGPEHFGLVALSIALTGVIQLLRDFGYSTYIVQKKDIEERELAFINSRVVCFGTLAFLIVLIITFPIVRFYDHRELLWIMPLTALQFIMNSFIIVPLALFRKEFEFGKIAKIEIFSNLLSILIGLILLLFFRNYWVILITLISNYIFQVIFTFSYSNWKFKFAYPINPELNKLSKSFGAYFTLTNLVTFISYNIDRLIIGKISGNAVLGVYSKSYDLGVSNLEKVTYPLQKIYFSSLAKNRHEEKEIFFQFLFLMNAMLLLIVGPLLIFTDLLIDSLFNNSWAEMKEMLPPFLLASFIAMSILITYNLLLVKTQVKRYLGFGLAKAILATIAIIIASFIGAKAVAWSYFIYQFVFFIPLCNMVLKGSDHTKKDRYKILANMSMIVCSSIITVAVPWILVHYGITNIPVAFCVFAGGLLFLYSFFWPQITNYGTFKDFFRILLSRKVLSGS